MSHVTQDHSSALVVELFEFRVSGQSISRDSEIISPWHFNYVLGQYTILAIYNFAYHLCAQTYTINTLVIFVLQTEICQPPIMVWPADFCLNEMKSYYTFTCHYSDVIMRAMASKILGLLIICSTVCCGADQRKKIKAPCHWPLWGNPPMPVDYSHKSNTEDVFVWWRHVFAGGGKWDGGLLHLYTPLEQPLWHQVFDRPRQYYRWKCKRVVK